MKEEYRKFIVSFLEGKDWTTPTDIGNAWGKNVGGDVGQYHSSWASPKCKELVERGVLERNHRGHYRLRKDK